MDLGWKRTLTFCYFLFMVGFMIIFATEFYEANKDLIKNRKDDEEVEEVITANQLIEEKDVQIILSNSKYNDILDYDAYLNGAKAEDSFLDTENAKSIKEVIDNIITTYKTNLESNAYYYYGYSSTMDFCEFFNDAINELSYYEIESIDDIYVYYTYIYGYNNYFNEQINVNDFDPILVKEYYADTIDNYLYMEGYHLLICMKDGASIVYTSNYSDEEKELAKELYNKIYAITILIEENEETGFGKKAFFNELVSLFENGNFASPTVELSEYLNLNGTSATDFEDYYINGFSIVTEDLSVSDGNMVESFENACREIFNSQLDKLVQNKKVEEVVIHEDVIETIYGYHLYVNTLSSIEELYEDDELLGVPNIVEFALFIEEYNNSSDDTYVTPAGLLSGYLKAKDESNETEVNEWLSKILDLTQELNIREFDNLTIENIEKDFVEKYLIDYTNYNKIKDAEDFSYDNITHNDAIYTSNSYFYAPVFSVYASANNFDYIRYNYMYDHASELGFGDMEEEVKTQLQTSIASLNLKLTTIRDKSYEFNNGLFEKLNKEMYDELIAHFNELK